MNSNVVWFKCQRKDVKPELAKENRKFIYGAVKNGGCAKEFELAIMWLQDGWREEDLTLFQKPFPNRYNLNSEIKSVKKR